MNTANKNTAISKVLEQLKAVFLADESLGESEIQNILKRYELAGKHSQGYICFDPDISIELLEYISRNYDTASFYSPNGELFKTSSIEYAIDGIIEDLDDGELTVDEVGFDKDDLRDLQKICELFDYISM